jgi:hypothetical protein
MVQPGESVNLQLQDHHYLFIMDPVYSDRVITFECIGAVQWFGFLVRKSRVARVRRALVHRRATIGDGVVML